MADPRIEASIAFGRTIHWAAVQIGSKTKLGERVGVPKSVVKQVTSGQAHELPRGVLLLLIGAVQTEVHPEVLKHIRGLVDHITSERDLTSERQLRLV